MFDLHGEYKERKPPCLGTSTQANCISVMFFLDRNREDASISVYKLQLLLDDGESADLFNCIAIKCVGAYPGRDGLILY